MAHYMLQPKRPSMLEQVGQKMKDVAGTIGTLHGIYQAGKTIFQAGQAVAPLVTALL